MRRSQLAVNAVSTIRAELPASLAAYHAAGFRYVEFPLHYVRAYLDKGHALVDVRDLLDRHEMRCIGGFEGIVECFSPPELSNCNSDRVLPGEGVLDLGALLGQIERHGYEGYDSIELFNEALWAMPVEQAAQCMYDSLLPFCEDAGP
jgi:sugar phosphate isomerase/epimerase